MSRNDLPRTMSYGNIRDGTISRQTVVTSSTTRGPIETRANLIRIPRSMPLKDNR